MGCLDMDFTDAKAWLSLTRAENNKIQRNLDKIYELRESIDAIGGLNDGDRVQSTPNQDKIGSMVARLVDLENETQVLIDEYVGDCLKVTDLLEKICSKKETKVISHIYLRNRTISETARIMKAQESARKYRISLKKHIKMP